MVAGSTKQVDWAAVSADARFRRLHRRKTRFLALLMLFSLACFFMLPIGAAWWPELFRHRIAGPVNFGIALALSEFAMAWLVAAIYLWRANREFDRLATEINTEIYAGLRQRSSP